MHNYLSATGTAVRDKVEQTLLDEIALGNYVISETKPTIVSALGAVPKPDSEDVRLIHDCSQPEGSAVNNYADTESFKYQTLEDAVRLLKPGYYMAKIDLHHAYRSVSIHPSNYKATGLKWKFKSNPHKVTYLIDTRLPYGGKRAPEIFHRLTQSVRRMMAKKGFRALVVYLDDFLIVGATYAECLEAFNYLLELLQDLGFEISWHKVVSPTQVLIFLGVELNTVSQTMSLPQHKLVELQAFVLGFAQRRRASKRQLQVLAGKLSWASRVVYGGRTFLRRILDVMNGLKSPGAKFLLTDDFYADLAWWSDFLATFNGKCLFLDRVPLTTVQTDACYEAAGAFYNGDWLYYNFSIESFLRIKGNEIKQKLPITLNILRGIFYLLNMNNSYDATFWAVCLVMFFGLFRKSHLLPLSDTKFDSNKQFSRSSFKFYYWGILLTVKWSKTIQFRERSVQIPLPRIPGSIFCPVSSLQHALSFTSGAPAHSHAFSYLDLPYCNRRCMTYRSFVSKLRSCLRSLGVSPDDYAGHSFRRGGASFAFQAGVPIEMIRMLGDWKSNSVFCISLCPFVSGFRALTY